MSEVTFKNRDIESYIAIAPSAAQPVPRRLRRIVKAEAPQAEERFRYGMPFYELHGRLVKFAVLKAHFGVYGVERLADGSLDVASAAHKRVLIRASLEPAE